MAVDFCIGFFHECYAACMMHFPLHARVLEIGSAEADWIVDIKHERPDVHVTALDWRPAKGSSADKVLQGDVMLFDFPPASFDAIVAISTVEHIGLGHYKDPVDQDGDRKTMTRVGRWLKSGGWAYLDVPYRPFGNYEVHSTRFRAYDIDNVLSRLVKPSGLAISGARMFHNDHPDGPYMAMVLEKA